VRLAFEEGLGELLRLVALYWVYWVYWVYWSRLRPLPGAPELLRACHEHGLRVVLASSADPQDLQILRVRRGQVSG
jgi:phosphoserine phosphatase